MPGCYSTNNSDGKNSHKSPCPAVNIKNAIGKENIIDVLIIGAGCAGWPAALYGSRANLNTWIILGPTPGGALTETSYVENWPGSKPTLGTELIKGLQEQAEHFNAQVLEDVVDQVDFSQWPFKVMTQEGHTLHALSVIIATGSTPLLLKVKGEEEYWGKGVTTCAVCDAAFYKDKEVVIVGGGDTAVEEALLLAKYARTVTILVRGDKMRAAACMQDKLSGYAHIKVVYNRSVKEILGNDSHVTGLTMYHTKENQTYHMPIDGVFLAIGHKPNSQLFKDFINLDPQGYIQINDRNQSTNVPGVFAAGDVEDHVYRQAGVAAGSGIKAALDALTFLNDIGYNDDIATQLESNRFKITRSIKKKSVKQVKGLAELDTLIQEDKKPIIVDFYAQYCPSCIAMLPVFESVAQKFQDKAHFIKIDADEHPDIVTKYQIMKVPALLIFLNGKLESQINKTMDRKELLQLVESFISK